MPAPYGLREVLLYVPKESARAQMLEAKSNLLRLQQEIPLTEPEIAAVEEGVAAYKTLVDSLQDVRTPAGQTPREIASQPDASAKTIKS